MKRWLLLLLLFSAVLEAQIVLGPKAEISLITCGPSQQELYSAFGHTAVRVKDPSKGIDWVYNYGIFDFDQPNFYLNFAKGNLLYMLAVIEWPRFENQYVRDGRFIHQQVLNLDSSQSQAYFDFLIWNAKPENRDYYYDYFYDNCATRVRMGLEEVLGVEKVIFSEETYFKPPLSIRDLTDEYLAEQPWGDFGIDFCLGLPMDKTANAKVEMFLPDLCEFAFSKAIISSGESSIPLVREFRELHRQKTIVEKSIWTPFLFFSILLCLTVALTIVFYQNPRTLRFFDGSLFFVNGLLGILLLSLWLFTDHKAAASNYNILVFFPLNIAVMGAIFKAKVGPKVKKYLTLLPFYYALILAAWLFIPQELHLALIPWTAVFMLRSWHISYKSKEL